MALDTPHKGNKVAVYPTTPRFGAKHYRCKVQVNHLRFVTKDTLDTVVDARWWMSRSAAASVVYCSVWVSPSVDSPLPATSGRGTAGGCGYHKESAALEDALDSAGIRFEKHFNGCGDAAMKSAIEAVAAYLGVEGKVI